MELKKETEFDVRVFYEEAKDWEAELCLDTFAKLIYELEIKPLIEGKEKNIKRVGEEK